MPTHKKKKNKNSKPRAVSIKKKLFPPRVDKYLSAKSVGIISRERKCIVQYKVL